MLPKLPRADDEWPLLDPDAGGSPWAWLGKAFGAQEKTGSGRLLSGENLASTCADATSLTVNKRVAIVDARHRPTPHADRDRRDLLNWQMPEHHCLSRGPGCSCGVLCTWGERPLVVGPRVACLINPGATGHATIALAPTLQSLYY